MGTAAVHQKARAGIVKAQLSGREWTSIDCHYCNTLGIGLAISASLRMYGKIEG
jgi:hypothetical protein